MHNNYLSLSLIYETKPGYTIQEPFFMKEKEKRQKTKKATEEKNTEAPTRKSSRLENSKLT